MNFAVHILLSSPVPVQKCLTYKNCYMVTMAMCMHVAFDFTLQHTSYRSHPKVHVASSRKPLQIGYNGSTICIIIISKVMNSNI